MFEALDKAPEKWLKTCVTIAIYTGLRLSNTVLAGHRDLRMTKRYGHLNVDSLRDAVKVLRHVFVTVENSEAKASG